MILYNGPSMLDGSPIVAIATLASTNVKTGDMIQTWIIRSDMSPMDAVRVGADSAICGNCPHRHFSGGACYVLPFQAPTAIYRAFQRGRYSSAKLSAKILRAANYTPIRVGSYGDPAAIPMFVWENFVGAHEHTGYTHQWRTADKRLSRYCMASVDSAIEETEARAKGWRTFRVLRAGESVPSVSRTFECLSTARGTNCADCKACDGAKGAEDTRASVWIDVHGARAKRFTLPVVQ